MKPFSLDTVLDYRQRLEDLAKNHLAEARQAVEEVRSQLEVQQQEYAALVTQVEQATSKGVAINDLIRYEEHLTYLSNTVKALKQELEAKNEQAAKMQDELLKKSRERQVMDKLKERQNSAYKQYLDKKEAATLDEIAIIYHNK